MLLDPRIFIHMESLYLGLSYMEIPLYRIRSMIWFSYKYSTIYNMHVSVRKKVMSVSTKGNFIIFHIRNLEVFIA